MNCWRTCVWVSVYIAASNKLETKTHIELFHVWILITFICYRANESWRRTRKERKQQKSWEKTVKMSKYLSRWGLILSTKKLKKSANDCVEIVGFVTKVKLFESCTHFALKQCWLSFWFICIHILAEKSFSFPGFSLAFSICRVFKRVNQI